VGLKAFSQDYYSRIVGGRLDVVLRTLKIMKEEGVWVEVVNLIVPTLNDNMEEIKKMCLWIKDNLGPQTPLHFLRFYPMYKLSHLNRTSKEKLIEAYNIAKETGLKYVYTGNILDGKEDTYCPECNKVLISREIYSIKKNHLKTNNKDNKSKNRCPYCNTKIYGKF
jgi:pyruvate formate lyase activating enzyme